MHLSLNFLSNKTDALIAILILAVGSISIAGTSQFVMGQDGNTLKNLLGGCIYSACKDTKITGNVTNGILGGCIYGACENTKITGLGQSGGGQPTPTTGTLTVIKKLNCEVSCRADQFKITVTGNNVSPETFDASTTGTKVTLDAGDYTVSETAIGLPAPFKPSFSDDCKVNADGKTASGNIKAGGTQICTITNLVSLSLPT